MGVPTTLQQGGEKLVALTMAAEILSIEDWVLLGGTVPAVKDKKDFMAGTGKAVTGLNDKDQSLLT